MDINTIIDGALSGLTVDSINVNVNYLENPKQADKRSDPWITYVDISEGSDFNANDSEQVRAFYYDVDIMTRKPYLVPALKKEIERRMENVGFTTLTHSSTTYNEGIAHKALSFFITKLKEEL